MPSLPAIFPLAALGPLSFASAAARSPEHASPPNVLCTAVGDFRPEPGCYTEWWQRETDKIVATAMTDVAEEPGETTSALPAQAEWAETLSDQLRARVLAVRRK